VEIQSLNSVLACELERNGIVSKDSLLVCVMTTSSEWEAGLVTNRLEELGIAASATGGATAEFRGEAPGAVRVLVDSRDKEEASAVVQELLEARQKRLAKDKECEKAMVESGTLRPSTGRVFMILFCLDCLTGILATVGLFTLQRGVAIRA
jgi:hypothetical protein